MTHHKYVNAEDLAKVENLDMSSTRCVPVTQLVLACSQGNCVCVRQICVTYREEQSNQ